MDTNRISILSQDLSLGGDVGQDATLRGFTVVKAEKGPVEPVLIPANNPSMIYEILGYTSVKYPQIQEVLDFNKTHDIYVSAPYSAGVETDGLMEMESKIPVALVSTAGIFPAMDLVGLNGTPLEKVKEGSSVEGISSFEEDPAVMIPVGSEDSLFQESSILQKATASPIEYANDVFTINASFDIGSAMDSPAGIDFFNKEEFNFKDEPGRVLSATGDFPELILDIPGEDLLTITVKVEGTDYSLVTSNGETICEIAKPTNTISVLKENVQTLSSSAPAVARKYLTQTAMANIWGSSDFVSSVKVYWKANLCKEAIKATLLPKYVSDHTINISVPSQVLGNKITITASEKVTPSSYKTKTVTGSLLDSDTDGFGSTLSFEDKLENQYLIDVVVLDSFDDNEVYSATKDVSSPMLPSLNFRLSRGVRYVTDASVETVWESIATEPDYDTVEVFFNPYSYTGVEDSAFFHVADTHKLSRFVASIDISPATANEEIPELTFGYNYFILTNKFLRKSTFTKENYWSPLVGASASMYLSCVEKKKGGVAPMYLNYNGLGGQLGISVKKPLYKFTKGQLTRLDSAGYNPIIRDQSYGVMIVGQKTAKGGELSDWSYIGHTSAFLYLQREIRDKIMVPQLGKPNNSFYRELRGEQVDMILRTRTEGSSKIWAEAVGDTSTAVNTADVMLDRKFAIQVKVKVDIFSEGVELTLINYAQGTEIE